MLNTRVPRFAHMGQIPLIIITFFSCGLSFWLTVRFCATLAPGHAIAELLAIGITWELAKLTFGTMGTRRIKRGPPEQKGSGYALVGVSCLLAAGSIIASLAFLMQTDHQVSQDAAQASQQSLHASKTYERDSASLRALDNQINQLAALAEQYRSKGMVTQGVRTLERIAPLREARTAQAQGLSAQEAAISTSGSAAVTGPFLGAASAWRLAAQSVLAVMLEAVSMIALSLLCDQPSSANVGGGASPNRPASNVVRLKVAAPRITSDAGLHRLASDTPAGGGDANEQPPPAHRMNANAASSRITYDASLHHPASGASSCGFSMMRQPAGAHRIDASTASKRITCDAVLHQPASSASSCGFSMMRQPAGAHRIDASTASKRITCDAVMHQPASVRGHAGAALALVAPQDTARPGRDVHRLSVLYAQAKQLVRSAQVRPSYRQMRQALGASQPVVQRFLRDLVAEGVLCRSGRQYALVSALDATGGAA